MPNPDQITVSISIDTEEDDWATYQSCGATTENIAELIELQDLFDRHGARPSYLVNRPPLRQTPAVETLGRLAEHPAVEIGAHCHPWNTPPLTDEGAHRSMMCQFSVEENLAKLGEIRSLLQSELGVTPRVFRAGRWGLGPTLAEALRQDGYQIDCSVSPFVDWSSEHGPDYSNAPHAPYRFDPADPLTPNPDGAMLQLPTTVGFLTGPSRPRAALRRSLERSAIRHLKIVGVLDRTGILARRWLSPETSTGAEMVRLARNLVARGETFLQLTFHSCTLLPGATPFVRTPEDRARFMGAIDELLDYCVKSGFTFRTLSEAAEVVDPRAQSSTASS